MKKKIKLVQDHWDNGKFYPAGSIIELDEEKVDFILKAQYNNRKIDLEEEKEFEEKFLKDVKYTSKILTKSKK